MQIKIAFKAIFFSGWGKFSRTEPQSAPQDATSVFGDPAEQNRCGRYSAGNRRALNQLMREEGGKDTRDGTPHKTTRDLF